MKPIWFGGSFNPIHQAHLICARAAAEAAGFDRVILVPAAQPPHKPQDTALASPLDRLRMCQLAVDGSELFRVDDLELKRTDPSYTIDTAAALKAQGWDRITWLIGADMLLYLPKWHEVDRLMREIDFVVMARPGWNIDWRLLPPEFRKLEKNIVQTPMIGISATDIRARVAAGLSIEYLTPPSVVRYIHDRGLYR